MAALMTGKLSISFGDCSTDELKALLMGSRVDRLYRSDSLDAFGG
jgi:hypothetical protein